MSKCHIVGNHMTRLINSWVTCYLLLEDCYFIANSVDPDELSALHLDLYCLQKSVYRSH